VSQGGPGTGLLSHAVAHAVSSALGRFTTVFGKGTGGTTPLAPPGPSLGHRLSRAAARDQDPDRLRADRIMRTRGRRVQAMMVRRVRRSCRPGVVHEWNDEPSAISTAWLSTLPCVHLPPINQLV
jgi:hypothetical protein